MKFFVISALLTLILMVSEIFKIIDWPLWAVYLPLLVWAGVVLLWWIFLGLVIIGTLIVGLIAIIKD